MPTPKLPRETLQEAADLVEQYGGSKYASRASGIPETTLRGRLKQAQLNGIKPTKPKEEIKPHIQERLGRVHMVISDIQAKPNVQHDHLEWIGNYAVEKRPDVIVQIGDWADMPSLSLYDKGKRCYEGRRYVKDCEAANYSLERFERVLEDYNRTHTATPYNPRKVLTYGNHEYRIERIFSCLKSRLQIAPMYVKRKTKSRD